MTRESYQLTCKVIILPEGAESLRVLLLVIIPPETEVLVRLHDPGPGPHDVAPRLQPDHLFTVAAVLVPRQLQAGTDLCIHVHDEGSHLELLLFKRWSHDRYKRSTSLLSHILKLGFL